MISPILLLASANTMLGVAHERHWGRGGVAFIDHVGFRSHYDNEIRRSSWPIPAGEGVEDLVRFATARNILSTEKPTLGEIFLLWTPFGKRFTHAGIVAAVEREGRFADGRRYYECITIEAERRNHGIARGACQTTHRICPEYGDRFIRWVDLDGRRQIGNPLATSQICMESMRSAAAA